MLPDLSKKNINNQTFEFSLHIFIKVIPIIIFLLIPTYPFVLKFWLGNSYSEIIHDLTKIFSLSIIFSCISHILVTKFEATKTLYRNLKIEFLLMPIFLLGLFYLTIENYTLISISILILFKEISLLFLRLNFLKSEIKFINNYYLFLLYFLIILFLSFYNEYLYYLSILFLVINFLKNDYK